MSDANYIALYTFTDMLVKKANRHLDKGEREPAWEIWKYVFNARICEIGYAHTYTVKEPAWPLLKWKLEQLRLRCHPENFDPSTGSFGMSLDDGQATPAAASSLGSSTLSVEHTENKTH